MYSATACTGVSRGRQGTEGIGRADLLHSSEHAGAVGVGKCQSTGGRFERRCRRLGSRQATRGANLRRRVWTVHQSAIVLRHERNAARCAQKKRSD